LVRVLRVSDPLGPNLEEEAARREILQAALAHLEDSRKKAETEFDAIYQDLAGHYRERLAAVTGKDDTETSVSPKHRKHFSRLSRDLLRVERQPPCACATKARLTTKLSGNLNTSLTCARPVGRLPKLYGPIVDLIHTARSEMNVRFSGKLVVVAGGTGGLGRAVSLAFLAEGAKVVVTYRDQKDLMP